MENEKKEIVDETTTTDTRTETVEEAVTSNTEPIDLRPTQPNYKNLIMAIAALVFVIVLGFYASAYFENLALEKQVVEKSKLLKATSDSVKALGDEVVKTTNELNALDAKYQDSLDNAMYSEEFRMLDSLAKEFHDKNLNKGGSK
jgi:hypothetical protein